MDERLIQRQVDEEISIGDYVLSGGELPAMVLMDAVLRLLPGVLNHAQSAEQDSFVDGLFDCPHYTRPEEYQGCACRMSCCPATTPALPAGDSSSRWGARPAVALICLPLARYPNRNLGCWLSISRNKIPHNNWSNPMNLLQQLEQEEIARLGKTIPDFAPGDTVIVQVKVKRRQP